MAACRLRGEVANATEEDQAHTSKSRKTKPIPNVHAIQLESTACHIASFLADDAEALAMMAMTSAAWWKAARHAKGYRLHTFQDADVGTATGLVVLDGRLVAAGVRGRSPSSPSTGGPYNWGGGAHRKPVWCAPGRPPPAASPGHTARTSATNPERWMDRNTSWCSPAG
eukprot:SAG31_NODE_1326_length_8761_cov_3.896791_6_plen_169_part_00